MDEYTDNEYTEEYSQDKTYKSGNNEDKPLASPSSGQNMSTSVQDFLKQSTEIQEEIRKLSELCQQISPKKDSFIEEVQSKEDYEEQNNHWAKINNMLETHGFSPISTMQDDFEQEIPDPNSLADSLVDVITEYSNLVRSYAEIEGDYEKLELENKELKALSEKYKKIEAQYRDLDKINQQLQEKISKSKHEPKEKEENRHKPHGKPGSDRALRVFKAFMEQEYNPLRETDGKVISIINNYEEQKQKTLQDISNYKKNIIELNKVLRQFEESKHDGRHQGALNRSKGNASDNSEQEFTEKSKILNSVVAQLKLKSYLEVPNALSKIQQVMLTLPGIDKFVKQICEEIMVSPSSRLDDVIDALQDLKKRLQNLEKFKLAISESLATVHDGDMLEKIKGLMYFCKLFEIRQKDDIISTVEGIFYFVHEIKLFLAVRDI